MRVISTLLPAEFSDLSGRMTTLMVMDTLVDDKPLVVGITVGKITGNTLDGVEVSAVGQEVIRRCARHHRLNYSDAAPVIVAGVQNVSDAVKRVTNVIKDAPDKALVLLVCRDKKVYDAAVTALHVNYGTTDVEM